MATERIAPKADQPRVSTGELGRAEKAGAGGMRSMRQISRT